MLESLTAVRSSLLYSVHTMSPADRDGPLRLIQFLSVSLLALVSGCGTPGAPQPPSLNLPDPVTDLSAMRTGNVVTLTWTMPRRSTDKLLLKGDIDVEVCRKQRAAADGRATMCEPASHVQLAPGADGSVSDTLPSALATGTPRPLTYFIELKSRNGRSAGMSNPAVAVAGEAPGPVTGLTGEVRKSGVVLRWNPSVPGVSVRLRRKLISAAPPKTKTGLLPNTAEPVEQNLLVDASPGATPAQALDKHITFGNTYEYRAQRVIRQQIGDNGIELDGELSAPIQVDAQDVFPPAVPMGIAAVSTAADPAAGSPASIDLSWQPNTEPDLAGYEVYRREDQTPWERISGDKPVVGPAFRDANVLPGHTYRYGVSAVDKGGHESARSAEASETVPSD